ncbi:hypothetical protein ACFQE0_04325 [Methylobacterium komagatae]|uniref:Glycosyltransferase family 1 protein n=1 Tax=Methylobacterium komagatae TaxID=374425 RepID=A0ABW2BHR9_9HYPH
MSRELNRVIIVDPSVVGESHILVNTGFIRHFAHIAREIIVIAEASHAQALQKYADLTGSDATISYRGYHDRSEVTGLIDKATSEAPTDLLFFFNLEYNVWLHCNIAGRKHYKGLKCWVFHSHLASLGKSGLHNKVIAKLKAFFLINLFPNNRFIVLGENIRANTLRALPGFVRAKRLHSVIHPVGVHGQNAKPSGNAPSIKGGTSVLFLHGWHRLPETRLQTLARLAEIAQAKGCFDFVEIKNEFSNSALGRSFSKPYNERLDTIRAADFLLQLPTDPYTFQASGAIMDMIVTQTPGIGIASDFSKYLESRVGKFGYFFETDDEIVEFMSHFPAKQHADDYQNFVSNLATASRESTSSVAPT